MKMNEIFQEYAHEYIERFAETMPFEHRKVIDAIINCRTQYCGTMIYQCEQCGQNHIVYRSCGNRHCPNCQHHKTHQWLMKQMERQLPGHHFMITFTVPQKLRRFIRSHQRLCYSALFKASSETMKKLAADEKYIGGDLPGFLGVLHTWGRQLTYHPHIYLVEFPKGNHIQLGPLCRPWRRLIKKGRPVASFAHQLLSPRKGHVQNLQGQVPG